MSDLPNQVGRVIKGGYNFRFGHYLNQGFVIVQKALGPFAGFCLLFLLISWIFELVKIELGIIGTLVGLVFSLVVSPCLMAGFYYTSRKVDENQIFEFSDFFKGFNWASKIGTYAVIEAVLYAICFAPLLVLGYINFDALLTGDIYSLPYASLINGSLLVFLGVIPAIYLSVAWLFTPFLIIFYDMEAWPAMEASRKIITKKWFLFLIFLIIAGIISFLGIIGLIIGLLITIPASICMIYAAFVDIVGMPDSTLEDDILDHLIEEI